jgi:hypothetical protein
MIRLPLVALVLAPLLAGCGIPDLVAHTVKSIEKSQRDGGNQAEASQSAGQQQPAATADEPPPPAAAPIPRRTSVTVEELPSR